MLLDFNFLIFLTTGGCKLRLKPMKIREIIFIVLQNMLLPDIIYTAVFEYYNKTSIAIMLI